MIKRLDVQNILRQEPSAGTVLSLYLDMSVNSENKRTYQIYLNQQKSRFAELASDRENHHRVPIGAAFERIERWIADEYREENRGVALFVDLGGAWLEALQVPVPLRNKLVLAPRAVIGPLCELLETHRKHAILLIDRSHLRIVTVEMNSVIDERTIEKDAYPTPNDLQSGGYAQQNIQRWKAEETRQFWKDFAHDIETYDRQHRPDGYVLLGTTENTRNFLDFLPESIAQRIEHTGHARPDERPHELLARLADVFHEQAEHSRALAVETVRERVRNNHLAIAGVRDALEQLQEGKVDTLVIAQDLEKDGVQCMQCSFLMPRRDGACPYCGGELRDGIDLVESMIRLAAQQEVTMEFVDGESMRELNGVGALLKF